MDISAESDMEKSKLWNRHFCGLRTRGHKFSTNSMKTIHGLTLFSWFKGVKGSIECLPIGSCKETNEWSKGNEGDKGKVKGMKGVKESDTGK